MDKKTIVLGDLGIGGERGRIMHRGGCATTVTGTEYKDPQKTIKNMKNLIILGKMDNSTDHTFDCANRVYSRGG